MFRETSQGDLGAPQDLIRGAQCKVKIQGPSSKIVNNLGRQWSVERTWTLGACVASAARRPELPLYFSLINIKKLLRFIFFLTKIIFSVLQRA